MKFATATLMSLLALCDAKNNLRSSRKLMDKEGCVLLLNDIQFANLSSPDKEEYWECQLGDMILPIDGMASWWMEENHDCMISAETMLYSPGTVMYGDRLEVPNGGANITLTPMTTSNDDDVNDNVGDQNVTTGDDNDNHNKHPKGKKGAAPKKKKQSKSGKKGGTKINKNNNNRKLATVTGEKTVLAVRVVAKDRSTTNSADEISDSIFGTDGDRINMVSQYKACSNNKLRFTPTTHRRTTNGVYTVNIPSQSVTGTNQVAVRNAVTTQLAADLGRNWQSKFDHIMLCLPPGTAGGWIAYAYVNHKISVYNDRWCTYLSAQMHEIGHNLNLGHSGEASKKYGDQSGMMGYSYAGDDGPAMCFNGPKSWQLGWYSDRHSIAQPLRAPWGGQLVGVVDYGRSRRQHIVVLKINGDTENDYFVTFNRKAGMNSGTREGGNQVLVARRSKEDGYAPSTLVAKLSQLGKYTIANFGGTGKAVTITAHYIATSATPSFAIITVVAN